MELRSLTTPVDFPVESDVICDDDNEDDKDDDDVRSDDAFSTEPEFANVERSLVRMISIGSSPTEARLVLCSFRPFDTRERGGRTYAHVLTGFLDLCRVLYKIHRTNLDHLRDFVHCEAKQERERERERERVVLAVGNRKRPRLLSDRVEESE